MWVARASVVAASTSAIGVDTERDWHFMMVQDTHSVAVLFPKSQAPGETDEEKASREAMEGIGKRSCSETWVCVGQER